MVFMAFKDNEELGSMEVYSIGGEDFSQKESMEIPGLPAYNTGKGPAGPVLQRSLTSRFAGRD